MDRYDIKTEVLVRAGRNTSSAWLSEAFLNDWINQTHRWAAGYKPWPYTEGRSQTTYTGVETWEFEGYKSDSIRFIQVGGDRFQKLNFEDYKIYKEEQAGGTDKVYADFAGLVYVNPDSGASGTLVAYGQYQPANIPDGDGATADDLTTVFTPHGDEGNQAIIEEILGKIANRESNAAEAINKHMIARGLLDELWQRIEDEQFAYQTKDRGIWERIDVIDGGYYQDGLKRDQF